MSNQYSGSTSDEKGAARIDGQPIFRQNNNSIRV